LKFGRATKHFFEELDSTTKNEGGKILRKNALAGVQEQWGEKKEKNSSKKDLKSPFFKVRILGKLDMASKRGEITVTSSKGRRKGTQRREGAR